MLLWTAEVESNFGDRVLGNADTEHLIAPPDKMGKFVGLSSKMRVSSDDAQASLLDEESVNRLKNQAPGWQVVEVDGKQRIRYASPHPLQYENNACKIIPFIFYAFFFFWTFDYAEAAVVDPGRSGR